MTMNVRNPSVKSNLPLMSVKLFVMFSGVCMAKTFLAAAIGGSYKSVLYCLEDDVHQELSVGLYPVRLADTHTL